MAPAVHPSPTAFFAWLRRLPRRLRLTADLWYVRRLACSAIARLHGITVDAVKWRIKRLRRLARSAGIDLPRRRRTKVVRCRLRRLPAAA